MNKNLQTIFATFSLPDHISYSQYSQYDIKTSIYIIDNIEELNFSKICKNLISFNIKNLTIITVTKKTLTDKFEEKIFKIDSNGLITKITNYLVSYDQFFNSWGIEKFLINQEISTKIETETSSVFKNIRGLNKTSFVIYKFVNLTWSEIKLKFQNLNIIITGGTNNKKHLFSLVHLKLAIFILCLEGDESFNKVWNSFNIISFINKGNPINTIKEKEIIEVENLQFLLNNNPKKDIKEVKKKAIFLQKRSLHSSTLLKNIDSNNNLLLKNLISNDSTSNISDHLSSYLKTIKNIIENNKISKKEAQYQIENTWVNIIKELIEDPSYLKKKYSHTLQNKILEAKKTLDLATQEGKTNKYFYNSKLKPFVSKIEMLMITFCIAITYAQKEIGYNYLCGIIGNKIIRYIYLNEKIDNFSTYLDEYKPKTSLNKTKDPSLIKDFFEINEFIKFLELEEPKDYLALGHFYLEIFSKFPTGIFMSIFNNAEGYYSNETQKLTIDVSYLDNIQKDIMIEPASFTYDLWTC